MTVFSTVVKVALGVAALSAGYGIVGLGAVAVLVNVFTALVFAYLVVSRLLKPHLEFDGRFSLSMFSAAWPLMLNNLLANAFFRADVLILKASRDSSEVGYYGTAYKFIDGLNIIPSTFTLAIFPLMSRYAASAREALVRAYTLALKALLIVSVPFAVGTTLLADELVLLVGGPDYLPHSATALRILIWFLPFSYVNSVTQYVLIAVERQRFLTVAFVVGAGFNVVANLILIPRIGYSGAALTTILSELVLMVPFGYAVRRELGAFPVLSLMWRPAAAAAVMGGIMLLLHGLNPLLLVPLAMAAYFGMLLPLRAFTAEEWELVRGMLRRKSRQSAL